MAGSFPDVRRTLVRFPGLALLLLGGMAGLGFGWANAAAGGSGVATLGAESEIGLSPLIPGAQPVWGARVLRDTLTLEITAAGEARASRRVSLHARGTAVVLELWVGENAQVAKGDLLIQLDTTEAALALAQAELSRLRAQADFEERRLASELLLDPDPAMREERVRVLRGVSGLAQAELGVEAASRALEQTRVRAPFSGRVTQVRVQPGNLVGAGAELLTVLQLHPLQVEVDVPEVELQGLQVGRPARLRFAALPGEDATGRIESLSPEVDPSTRSLRVRVAMDNPGERALPGMYARVRLEAQRFPDRILVPREAVVERDRRAVVFVASALDAEGLGVAEWRYVLPGARNETHVELLPLDGFEGVREGEIVLVEGHLTLAHLAPISLAGISNARVSSGRAP